MPLNKAQKEAVEYLDGPLLVLAGPGTGKTQLLSSKVAYILKNTDAGPENILCITFTEAGANNMRERLLGMIGQAARQVSIHTYHAFGSDILFQYKNYTTEPSRNLDEAISPVRQFKIIRNIQDNLSALDILKNARTSDIIETISSAKSARLSPDDLRAIAKRNLSDSAEINAEAAEILENLVPRMPYNDAMSQVYQPLAELFAKFSSDQNIVGNIEPEANALLLSLKEAMDEAVAGEKPKITPLTSWKNSTFELAGDGKYRLKNLIANKKLASLAEIYEQYQKELLESGLYDFDDMIEEAIKVLKTDEGFRLTLSERYQYILLDEFQDTNPSQFEIIKLLTDYEKPCVMAVGDDDQAIFEFQGANASNLIDFQNHYAAKVVTLTENYRSTAGILDTSHKIAEQILDSFAKKRKINKLLHSNRETVNPEIERHEFISADAEYYWVAEQVNNLVEAGEEQKEIAIITPKHKFIQPLLPYLKTYPKINIAYERRENILENPQISELITTSRYIYELSEGKKPSYRLPEILAFSFWEIPPEEVLNYTADGASEKVKTVVDFLSALAVKANELPLELLLDYLIGSATLEGFPTSPFLKFYEGQMDFEKFSLYENLMVLRENIRSYTKNQNPKLKDFITMLDDYEAANMGIINTSPYQDTDSAVQILTAHKAKGLEFKHVFIIATDNLAWGKAKGNNNFMALPKNLTQIRHTGTTDSELLRLFFVAITRAKERLYITNSIKNFAGQSPARLDYLNELPDEEANILSPMIPSGKVITHYDDLEEAKRQTDLQKSWISHYFKLTPNLKAILTKRLENYKLTASDLTTFTDIVYAGPMEFYKRKVLKMPPEPATAEMNYGNLIHVAFEKATREKLDDAAIIEFYKTTAMSLPVTEHEAKELLEKGVHSLEITLKAFGPIIRAEGGAAEVDFYHDHLSVGEVPITGKIDHMNVDTAKKTIEIYDFKTGKFHSSKWDANATLFKYKLQLGFYKLLVENSPQYKDYQVTRAHILFVTPDEDGLVYDKPYEYSEADEKELLALMLAVYRQIKSLDFVNNPELALEKDNTRTLKDIKEFIELMLAITT